MRGIVFLLSLVAVCVGAWAASSAADGIPLADPVPDIGEGPFTLRFEELTDAVDFPTDLAWLPDGTGRLLIAERDGRVRIWSAGGLLATPFLDLSATTPACQGCALSSITLHPGFGVSGDPGEGKVYTISQEPAGTGVAHFGVSSGEWVQSVLYEWTVSAVDPNQIDPASRREILRINEESAIHNLDQGRFGPDGYLYLAKGDDLTFLGAQELTSIHGKLLRIDVDDPSGNGRYSIPSDNPDPTGASGLAEIWAYGFRNPWRLTFDRMTGELWVADIGEDDLEEVDRIVAGGNYGWAEAEGSFAYLPGKGVTDDPEELPPAFDGIPPVGEYDQDEGDCSITGGVLYRGAAFPELAGVYLFSDWCSGRLFTLEPATGEFGVAQVDPAGDSVAAGVIAFAEDPAGEPVLALGGLTPQGSVLRLVGVEHQGVGPPPGVPSTMIVSKDDPAGSSLTLSWDPSICVDDEEVQIVYGAAGGLPAAEGGTFSPSGGVCGLSPTSPTVWSGTPAGPGLTWFLLVATDGAGTEGSWGSDSGLQERSGPGGGGSSATCGGIDRDLADLCP